MFGEGKKMKFSGKMVFGQVLLLLAIAFLSVFFIPKAQAGDDALWAIGGFVVGAIASDNHHHRRHHHEYRHPRDHREYYEEDVDYIRVCVSRSPYDAGCYYDKIPRHSHRVESYYYDCSWYEDYPREIRHNRRHQRHEDPMCTWMP